MNAHCSSPSDPSAPVAAAWRALYYFYSTPSRKLSDRPTKVGDHLPSPGSAENTPVENSTKTRIRDIRELMPNNLGEYSSSDIGKHSCPHATKNENLHVLVP
jgi:hypothetical protein